MDNFLNNPTQIFLVVGLVCLALELFFLGISGPLLFLGLGALIASGALALNLVAGLEAGILVTCLSGLILAIVLWKPLKKLQNQPSKPDRSSDMIGQTVQTKTEVSFVSGAVRYSGMNWNARIDPKETEARLIEAETTVTITSIDGNVLMVKPTN